MFPSQFEYHRPSSVQAAVALLAADPDAKLLAGGHSLMPAMKLRLASPASLVDLGGYRRAADLGRRRRDHRGDDDLPAAMDDRRAEVAFPMVAEAANVVGDPAVAAGARSAARWRTPTRPPISPRSSWR